MSFMTFFSRATLAKDNRHKNNPCDIEKQMIVLPNQVCVQGRGGDDSTGQGNDHK